MKHSQMNMLKRARHVLPYGSSTYSRSAVAFGDDAPLYMTHGDNYRAFDINGCEFVDCIMSLGACILGHRHPLVDEAIRRQLSLGTAMSLATPIEVEAAERLLTHFPADHMLQWGTSGSDATTGAIRLARSVTGKDTIVMPHDGYAGWHDWCLGGTQRGYGIPEPWDGESLQLTFHMEGLSELDSVLVTPTNIAAIIIEPDLHPDWLKPIREWCTKHGALMIADETMTFFRYPEWTGCAHYDVVPDISCQGKALGNGMPVSSIVGHRDIMKRFAPGDQPNCFFSSTWAGHPLSMAAVIATLDVMERENGCQKIWDNAQWLHQELIAMAAGIVGPPPFNRITWKNSAVARESRKILARHGVLLYSSHNLSLSHDFNAMKRLTAAWQTVVNAANTLHELEDTIATNGSEIEPLGIMRR